MAIVIDTGTGGTDTYTELQASIARWMNRTDLGADIPGFIANAEARIATDLRLRKMIVRLTMTTVAGASLPMPPGWLEFKSLGINGRPLDYMTPEQLSGRFANCSGLPHYYSIEGDELLFGPSPDGAYTVDLSYYKQIDPLFQSSTNWLLSSKPNLYLYAALAEACLFVKKPDQAASWAGLYGGIVEAMRTEDAMATHSGSGLVVRAR